MRLGIDVGKARIGLAASDASGALVLPVETIPAHPRSAAIRKIVAEAEGRRAIEVVVGLPKHMSGQEGDSAHSARLFASELAKRLPGVRICLIDERLSTTQAQAMLHTVGMDTRRSRKVIDQMAAQIILEQAIASERGSGLPPGELVGGK